MAPASSDEGYVKDLELLRRDKDAWFRVDPDSPLPQDLRPAFTGLAYFALDPAFRLRVRLVREENPEPIVLATSKGVPRPMIRYGHFDFEVGGVAQRLYAYKAAPEPGHHHADASLFVPFRDATSGKESYGAARYLDLDEHARDDEYVLDFNLAYNPYCAYSDDYVCPFPPKENWLAVPIHAGEKAFPLH